MSNPNEHVYWGIQYDWNDNYDDITYYEVWYTTSSNSPALFDTKGKADARLKTHFSRNPSAKVVKVILTIVEETE